jgi:hypothetical protein
MSEVGHSATENDVRDEGSFPPKRSPNAGDGCAANHFQPGLLLVAELDPIVDAGAGELGICNGPAAEIRIFITAVVASENKNVLAERATRC